MPWLDRTKLLKRLLGRRQSLVYNRAIIGNGPAVYAASCRMGLEGIVSKLVDAPYRSGRSKAWLKAKNPAAPGSTRFKES